MANQIKDSKFGIKSVSYNPQIVIRVISAQDTLIVTIIWLIETVFYCRKKSAFQRENYH